MVSQHLGEQARPVREPVPLRQTAQIIEEVAACAGIVAALPPQAPHAVQQRVQREGEQVESGEQIGQAPAAVPEIVLEIVALAGQAMEGLVLDLPAGSSEAGNPATFSAVTSKLVKKVL